MSTPALLEVLRDALARRYEVERQLGAGGMATVFLALSDPYPDNGDGAHRRLHRQGDGGGRYSQDRDALLAQG